MSLKSYGLIQSIYMQLSFQSVQVRMSRWFTIDIIMQVHLYTYDLPDDVVLDSKSVAIDTEAMGLCHNRDRLCLVQLSSGDGHCFLVHFPKADFSRSKNLVNLLSDDTITKVFHYARFDVAVLMRTFDVFIDNIYCTKIASKLTRTYTDRHSLKDLCENLLGIEVDKTQGQSDWGAPVLSHEQLNYAGTDVLYLHNLKEALDALLEREGRMEVAQACFDFLPYRAQLDLMAPEGFDVFAHH